MVRRSSLTVATVAVVIFLILSFTIFSGTSESPSTLKQSLSGALDASTERAASFATWITPGEKSPEIEYNHKPLNWTKVATLIETRDSPMLIPILQSWLANVPLDWPFVVWTGKENHHILQHSAVFQDAITSGRLNLTRLDLAGSPYRPSSTQTSTLSDFLANSNWFWTQFHPKAEWMLFFQLDSILCSKADQTVDDWLGYDYIGGPSEWSHGPGRDKIGGNGGLSLRRISSLYKITTETPRKPDETPEDVWFTWKLRENNATRWPEHEGRRLAAFSLSQGWLEDYTRNVDWRPLGMHYGSGHFGPIFRPRPDGGLTNALQRIVQYCPEFLYLRYAVDEYKDVDLSEFKPGASPKVYANPLDPEKEAAQDAQIGDLAVKINDLQERVRIMESEEIQASKVEEDEEEPSPVQQRPTVETSPL